MFLLNDLVLNIVEYRGYFSDISVLVSIINNVYLSEDIVTEAFIF
jgi:hypothetical protein